MPRDRRARALGNGAVCVHARARVCVHVREEERILENERLANVPVCLCVCGVRGRERAGV